MGAEWWSLPPKLSDRNRLSDAPYECDTLETCFEPKVWFRHLVAWPRNELAVCSVDAWTQEMGREKISAYHNAMNMDERCSAILELGGKWCRSKEDCPELKDLSLGANDPGPGNFDIDY